MVGFKGIRNFYPIFGYFLKFEVTTQPTTVSNKSLYQEWNGLYFLYIIDDMNNIIEVRKIVLQ
ncbi:MAG: hypothetical protein ACR2GN_02540 [Bacteroidia bacterium]